jgi:hypothetical protein
MRDGALADCELEIEDIEGVPPFTLLHRVKAGAQGLVSASRVPPMISSESLVPLIGFFKCCQQLLHALSVSS